FLIPFTFIFNPDLLLIGNDWFSIAISTLTSLVGVIALASSLQNYLYVPMNILQRGAMFIGAVLLIFPGVTTDIAGVSLVAAVFFWQRTQRRSNPLLPAEEKGA
ncbi:MAG: TRAP transporter permease, partial [Synergistaceae bacterium]|nr:TRAP transporter permease [Synergistaceae bacterium]